MAYNYGRSHNATVAERRRLDHGPFVIPFPKGSSREVRPFGIRLSGYRAVDYERIQIRIAAVQHKMEVVVERFGEIILPVNATEKDREIKEIADEVDNLYEIFVLDWKLYSTTKDIPVGYIAKFWKDPATIQKRLSRHREVITEDAWPLIKSLYFRPEHKGGKVLKRRKKSLAYTATKPSTGRLPPADARYQAYWKDITRVTPKYELPGFQRVKNIITQGGKATIITGENYTVRRLQGLLDHVIKDLPNIACRYRLNDLEKALSILEKLHPQEFDPQPEIEAIVEEPMTWFEQGHVWDNPAIEKPTYVPVVYCPSAALTRDELKTELTNSEFLALVETM